VTSVADRLFHGVKIRVCAAALCAFLGAPEGLVGQARKPSAPSQSPLAGLPAAPGAHLQKLRSVGDDAWLNLGSPAADPRWGKAGGRSYTSKMAFAPDLRVAFLFGEGVHGFVKPNGYYMDDFWAYDLQQHRWICIYPGAHPPTIDLTVRNRSEADKEGNPVPVAQMVHGYEMTAYDSDAKKFLFLPFSGDYWRAALEAKRRKWWTADLISSRHPVPWLYDTREGRWERPLPRGTCPPGKADATGIAILNYVPKKKQVLMIRPNEGAWWYDVASNTWTASNTRGKCPDSYNRVACYDSKRDRVYIASPNMPGTYDVATDSWLETRVKELPPRLGHGIPTEAGNMTYDSANDRVVLVVYGPGYAGGLYVYDPNTETWSAAKPPPFGGVQVNAFYDPVTNVHFYHAATDSADNGTFWVYRVKGARK
jgi:hypothetical protein